MAKEQAHGAIAILPIRLKEAEPASLVVIAQDTLELIYPLVVSNGCIAKA
jgi:hypothetical protein